MSASRPRVLYVLGIHHSGTTLLSNLLGQLDGFACVGELRSVWRKSVLPGARCGCGQRLADCPVWLPVLRSVLGEGQEREALAREMTRCQRETLAEFHTWRHVPSVLRHRAVGRGEDGPLARYGGQLARLYRAIAAQTGAEVIVDSSKEPTDAALLLRMAEVDASFVQIVRDPRGTVNSILRDHGRAQHAARRRPVPSTYAAFSWSAGNVASAAVRRAAGPGRSVLVRYEDFVARPGETIGAVAELAGGPVPATAAFEPEAVSMRAVHTVGGNDNRFRTGAVQVREDATWRSQLHPLDRAAVTTVCAPLMLHYGYRLAS
jgi:Sulfotransferase family